MPFTDTPEEATEESPAHEITRRLIETLRDNVVGDFNQRGGVKLRAVGIRLVVFTLLIDPPRSRWSLSSVAQRLHVSPAWLSRVALEFADELGMRAHWQRLEARDNYARGAAKGHQVRRTRLLRAGGTPS